MNNQKYWERRKYPKLYKGRTENSKDNWETPPYFFNLLDLEFNFDVDLASSEVNHLCDEYYTEENSGLKANCKGKTVFLNPPFSNKEIWLKKAYEESQKLDTIVIVIIPANTDTEWWHKYCMRKAYEIRFCKGRVNFLLNGEETKNGATFPLSIIVFSETKKENEERETPIFSTYYHKEKDLCKNRVKTKTLEGYL
jgi:phage N-6-adenine-methyltransferase